MNAALLTVALMTPAAPPARLQPAPDVRENVRAGLMWLAQQQKEDGTWPNANNTPVTHVVATAGLAFLMEGSTLKSGTYAPNLRRIVAWFEKNAAANGSLATENAGRNLYMPNHGFALLFLSCAHDVDDDPDRRKRLAKLIEKGIAFAAEGQSSRGGWSFVSARDGNDYDDCQSTVTVLQGLFAARKAGFDVPRKTTDRAVQYLVKATNREGGVIYSIVGGQVPMGNDGQPLITAGAAAGLLMADGGRPEALPRWVKYAYPMTIQQLPALQIGGSYALLQHYHLARACYALGENGHRALDPRATETELVKWSGYRATGFKALKELQNKDGSWPDQYYGPPYSTALTLVILQLDNGYLPALSR